MSKYADNYWRRQAAPRIAEIIAAMPDANQSAVRLQLRGASHHHAPNADARRAWDAEVEEQMKARQGERAEQPEAVTGNLFEENR
jgi:hypothetical protein